MSSDNPFNMRRRVQQESEPNMEFLQRRINRLGLPRSSDYSSGNSNDGFSYRSQMLEECQIARENIIQEFDQRTSIVTSGVHLEQEKPTHTATGIHQIRPSYLCDFGPFHKVISKNAERFPQNLPQHIPISAPFSCQNIDISKQNWHYWENPGPRYIRPQQLSYTSLMAPPSINQNSQLRQIRGRGMSTINRVALMQPASAQMQIQNQYEPRFGTLGRDVNAASYASLLGENYFRPIAPFTSTSQHGFKSIPREQILQGDQIHTRNPSEPSQESNPADLLLRELLDYLKKNKEVPQKEPTARIQSITKKNGSNLKEGSSSDLNASGFISHPDVQKSKGNLIPTHACLQNQERYSPVSELVTSPTDESAAGCMDSEKSNIRINAMISLPMLYRRPKPNTPSTSNYSSGKTQTEENEEFAQFTSHSNNNLPIDSWNVIKETGEYQLEKPNRFTNITEQFSKKEISQQQNVGEPQSTSDEDSSLDIIIEDEFITKGKGINPVDESLKENLTKMVKESSGVIEDLTSIGDVSTELKDSEYISEINRNKLNLLIKFLKENSSNDEEENESLKTKSKKGKSSAKANRGKAKNANKTKDPKENREDKNKKKISKTTEKKKRFPVKRDKSCNTNEWQLMNPDLNLEICSEEQILMQGVRDNQERSEFDEADLARPGPSTEDVPERHLTVYFDSEYKFCEYCLMARSKSEFWMNVATGQLICVFCLNGTTRYTELQRMASKTPEKKKRSRAGSINSGKNIFENLSAQEGSSESKTYNINYSAEGENIKTKKRKSLDEYIFHETEKKNKSCKISELSDEITLPKTKAVRKGRPKRNTTDKIKKSKDEEPPPYVPKLESSVRQDISDIKKQILEKVYCIGKYKRHDL